MDGWTDMVVYMCVELIRPSSSSFSLHSSSGCVVASMIEAQRGGVK